MTSQFITKQASRPFSGKQTFGGNHRQTTPASSPAWLPPLQIRESIVPTRERQPANFFRPPEPNRPVSQSTPGDLAPIQQQRPISQSVTQCQFEPSQSLIGLAEENDRFKTILQEMESYNTLLALSPSTPAHFSGLADCLKKIDWQIYSYTTAQSIENTSLKEIPYFDILDDIRTQAEREHVDFVDLAKTNAQIPLDLSNATIERTSQITQIWQAISSGNGKIKLIGTDAEKKTYLSWLVKLLDTSTGTKLLEYLNKGDQNDVFTNTYLGNHKGDLPDNILARATLEKWSLDAPKKSAAQPLGKDSGIGGATELGMNEDRDNYVNATSPNDLKEALITNKNGIIIGNYKFDFNKKSGTGGLVSIFPGVSQNENELHHEILTPAWITLGHEMGHVANFRGGATNLTDSPPAPVEKDRKHESIMNQLGKEPTEKMFLKWRNGEEYMVINAWENELRKEVGLSIRSSHVPYKTGLAIERYLSIKLDIEKIANETDRHYLQVPEIMAFSKKIATAFGNKKDKPDESFLNDEVNVALANEWHALKRRNFTRETHQVICTKIQANLANLGKLVKTTESIINQRQGKIPLEQLNKWKEYQNSFKELSEQTTEFSKGTSNISHDQLSRAIQSVDTFLFSLKNSIAKIPATPLIERSTTSRWNLFGNKS